MKAIKCDLSKMLTDIDGKTTNETIGFVLANILYNAPKVEGIADPRLKSILPDLRTKFITILSNGELTALQNFVNTIQHNGIRLQISGCLMEQFHTNNQVEVDDNWNPLNTSKDVAKD